MPGPKARTAQSVGGARSDLERLRGALSALEKHCIENGKNSTYESEHKVNNATRMIP